MNEYYTMSYRIYPNPEQRASISNAMGACLTLHNFALGAMIEHYEHTNEVLPPRLSDYIREPHLDLSGVDPFSLSHTIVALHKTFATEIKHGAYPKPKRTHRKQSYHTSASGKPIKIKGNRLLLPLIGKVKIILHRPLPSRIPVGVIIVKSPSGIYHVNFLFSRPIAMTKEVTLPNEDNTLGLDYSSPHFYVDSNSQSPNHPPRFYEAEEGKIERERAKLRRMQRGSHNYEKQRRKLARIQETVANRRWDYLHKLSRRLADQYDYIAVEDLDLQGIARQYQLAKHTLDNAFGIFVRMLTYKMDWRGKRLVKISRWAPSSQKCNFCGALNKKLTLSDRFWVCPSCGKHNARDHNAALNLRDYLTR